MVSIQMARGSNPEKVAFFLSENFLSSMLCGQRSRCRTYVMWVELGHSHFYTCQPFQM